MQLQINDNYRLDSDKFCVIVQRKNVVKDGDNQGKEYWVNTAYCTTIEQAVTAVLEQTIRLSDAMKVQELIDTIKQVRTDIERAVQRVKPLFA